MTIATKKKRMKSLPDLPYEGTNSYVQQREERVQQNNNKLISLGLPAMTTPALKVSAILTF
jgi:hypothetical protein